jgi:hypothetical protein
MNIVELTTAIRDGMAKYLKEHPECLNQDDVVYAGLQEGMVASRGRLSPFTARELANLETTVYKGSLIAQKGLLRC